MMKNILVILFVFSIAFANAQSDKALVRQGNKSYQNNDFPKAEIDYRKALDKNPNSLSGTFNLADAVYEQENFEKSAEMFAKIGEADLAKDQKGMAYYNLGNSLLKAKQYEPSIEAYKKALRNNPSNEDARYNLEYARQMLKNQQENQDQKKPDQDKKDDQKQDQEKKEDQKKKNDQKDKQDQNQEKPQDNPDDQGKPEQQMNDQQSKQISKKDAERMLEALKNNEKKTLEKLKKGKKENARVIKKEKDW
ncbi:MAG: tetratricopeptide repeat protein [Bacteroidales bacterium]|jgi:Ca-activated chloride channel family protein|nr:tetratricopeptide repeat protein [Bacteroidales bacterium]